MLPLPQKCFRLNEIVLNHSRTVYPSKKLRILIRNFNSYFFIAFFMQMISENEKHFCALTIFV